MRLPILIAAGGAPWEADLVAALERGSAAVTVARRCVDVVDLLAVAASGQGRAALVSASLRRLDADAVDRLLAADVVPVGVVARGDTAAEDRLRALGIDHLVPADADPGVVAAVLVEAVRGRPGGFGAGGRRTHRPHVRRPGDVDGDPARAEVLRSSPRSRPDAARCVAVWGPTGAPGRTTLAVTLADELARLGRSSLLVDADVYGGTVAAELGLLDESPGLAAACRAGGRAAGWTRRRSRRCAGSCAPGCGCSPASRSPRGGPSCARLRSRRCSPRPGSSPTITVVDCGFCLETDEELSFDSLAPRRNGATLAVLDDADLVLVVGAADPIGMQRLVRGLADLRDAEVAAPLWVVLNKVRRGVVPGDVHAELAAARCARSPAVTPSALLPLRPGFARRGARRPVARSARPVRPARYARAVGELAAAARRCCRHRRRDGAVDGARAAPLSGRMATCRGEEAVAEREPIG